MTLSLNSLANARRSLARVIREYGKGEISGDQARVHGYLLGQLLGYFKAEDDQAILERLEKLEALAGDSVKTTAARLRAHDQVV